MRSFIGRDRELAVLVELAGTGRAEFFVLYGRRRVGKTELLQRFCGGRRAAYFLAAQVRDKDNLTAFRRTLRESLDDPLLDTVEFSDWSAALGYAAQRAQTERLVVVLDEFPYLCEANPGVPSLLQRFWDTVGKHSQLMLVLCGSHVSFMEREVLAERSPLFGRRTAQRRLEPLSPTESLRFFAAWPLRQRIEAFAILGGMPAYLQRFDLAGDLESNLLREVLRPEGYLFDEVAFLLRTELNTPATYNSILHAVARGAERVGDVALSVGIDSTTANKYLHVLRELGLVERHVPLTDPDPLRSRKGVYRIGDRFLAFHFRHVQPHLSMIQTGQGKRIYREHILPDLPRLYEEGLVELMLEHLRLSCDELFGSEASEVGRHGGRALRALARLADGRLVAGLLSTVNADAAAKALHQAAAEAELAELRRNLQVEVLVLRYSPQEKGTRPLKIERKR
jgi:uncharacterized protein